MASTGPLAGDRPWTVRLNGADAHRFRPNAGTAAVPEAHFTAVFDDLAAHFTNYSLEDIRADVRLRLFDDIRRSTVLGKDFQHIVAQRITDARGQLAVRVGAGAALTELDIAVGIERTALPERVHDLVALVQISAALEHERTVAVLCQHIGGEQSRRAETDHHRTMLEPLFAVRNDDFRIGFITHEGHLQFFRKCLFVERRVQTHRIYPADLSAPRVNADAADRRLYVVCRQTGQRRASAMAACSGRSNGRRMPVTIRLTGCHRPFLYGARSALRPCCPYRLCCLSYPR